MKKKNENRISFNFKSSQAFFFFCLFMIVVAYLPVDVNVGLYVLSGE